MKDLVLLILFSVLISMASEAQKKIEPIPPKVSEIDEKTLPSTPSFINIPITIGLQKVWDDANNQIPSNFGDRYWPCQGARYEYSVRRDPITFSLNNLTLNANTKVFYKAKGEYCATCFLGNCIVPKITGSCGYDEDERRIRVGISSDLQLLPNYQFTSQTSIRDFTPENECRITIFSIDMTGKVIGGAKPAFERVLGNVDSKVANIEIRSKVESMWNKIQNPIKISKVGNLYINPEQIGVNDLHGNGQVIKGTLFLKANPIIASINNRQNIELPNLTNFSNGTDFTINLDVKLSNDSLSKVLTDAIISKKQEFKWFIFKRTFIADSAKIYSIDNSKIAVKLNFRGTKRGSLYFIGTPTLSSDKLNFSFPDASFDLATKDLLLKAAKWLFSNKITGLLREKARFGLSSKINDVRKKIDENINRQIDSIVLQGNVTVLSLNDIYPTKGGIALRISTTGNLSISVPSF